eukprot:contig_10659_g2544
MGKKKTGGKAQKLSLFEFNGGKEPVDEVLAALPSQPKALEDWQAEGVDPTSFRARTLAMREERDMQFAADDDAFLERDWSRRGPVAGEENAGPDNQFGGTAEADQNWGGARGRVVPGGGDAGMMGGPMDQPRDVDFSSVRRGPMAMADGAAAGPGAGTPADVDFGNMRRGMLPPGADAAAPGEALRDVDFSAVRRGPIPVAEGAASAGAGAPADVDFGNMRRGM